MKFYVGQTSDRLFCEKMVELGIGECVVPGKLPPRRYPWFFDCGTYGPWFRGEEWDAMLFERSLKVIEELKILPDFVVCPDLIAQGNDSLKHSVYWLPRVHRVAPVYLAVQDGMDPFDVRPLLRSEQFSGVFVGGTKRWKWSTLGQWVRTAHSQGVPCHVGRAASPRQIRWATSAGADSIDGNQPLWSRPHFHRFQLAVRHWGIQGAFSYE